jgi:hypothetical protein
MEKKLTPSGKDDQVIYSYKNICGRNDPHRLQGEKLNL